VTSSPLRPCAPRPILITGSHRSGSTWVGRMVASHPRVGYVHEPFNPEHHPACPVRHRWHHVTAEDQGRFFAYLRRHLAFRHAWWKEGGALRSPRGATRATFRTLVDLWRRLVGVRPLVKDPLAFFSAEWVAEKFEADVVVLIRHPAAFAGSLKRLGWAFGFGQLLSQPRLMEGYLEPFRDELERATRRPSDDVVEHAILAWRVIYHVAREYRRRHTGWLFIRHEDLSLDPEHEFGQLFARLGLDFHPRARQAIREHTSSANPAEVPGQVPQLLRRNSRENVRNWRHRLSPAEVNRVYRGTWDVARFFYSEDELGSGLESGRRAA
jgi:Sulfotransferase family